MTDDDFKRLEAKVDKLGEAIQKLILVEERQANQGARIGVVEQRITAVEVSHGKLESKVDKWINRGIGVWAVVVSLFALAQFGAKFLTK